MESRLPGASSPHARHSDAESVASTADLHRKVEDPIDETDRQEARCHSAAEEAEEAPEDETIQSDEREAEKLALVELASKTTHPLSVALHAVSALGEQASSLRGGAKVLDLIARYIDEEAKSALNSLVATMSFVHAHDLPDKKCLVIHFSNGKARNKAAAALFKAAKNLDRLDGQVPWTVELPQALDRPIAAKLSAQSKRRERMKSMTKELCSSTAVFGQRIREVALQICEDLGIEKKMLFCSDALALLQTVTEEYACEVLREAAIFAAHANRVTVLAKDIRLAMRSACDRAATSNALSVAHEHAAHSGENTLKRKRLLVADILPKSSSSSSRAKPDDPEQKGDTTRHGVQ